VRPEVCLEEARYRAPQEAGEEAAQQDQERTKGTEKAQSHAETGGRDGPDVELALAADVEEPGPEGDGDGEAGDAPCTRAA
jgi:hypothetical protein